MLAPQGLRIAARSLLPSTCGCGWMVAVGGISRMRFLGIVALCAALGGCAASRQEVIARLGEQYIGQNVDALVVKFGPPASTFKMNSGDTSYIWQLGNQTNTYADRGTRIRQHAILQSQRHCIENRRREPT